jgi:glycosyltransferase involved in cell wall biosynthesis
MLNAVRPDIAHLQSIHAHITPSVIHELAAHQVPIVWTLHDYKLICPNTHLLAHGSICEACRGGAFYHALLKRCKKSSRAASAVVTAEAYLHRALRITRLVHRFVSPSRFLIDKFAEFGWSRSRLVHIRNFLEHRHFIQERAAERGYVLYLGQVEPWKGLRHLLDAMERLPGTELRVAGEGSDRTTCERLVAERGLSNVRFLGRLSMYQVQEAIDGSSVGVVPSVCYENCPYTVMEFMAAGKPVVASNLGGIPELVEDGKTGFLVPPGDSAYLARSIGELIEKPAVRAAMGEVARRRAGEWFAPERHYEAVSALYQDLIGRTGRVGAAKR